MREDPEKNQTVTNNAPWFGFQKTEDVDRSLASLVKWNIIYITVATLWNVILVRQFNYRASRGRPTVRPFFMFPSITRKDADKDLQHCFKYLANFGFYKFGVEVRWSPIIIIITYYYYYLFSGCIFYYWLYVTYMVYFCFLFQICLMLTVLLIGVRMDFYALLHAFWLLILFHLRRSMKAKVWVFYLIFIAVTIPIQYFMTIGLPPSLCQGKYQHFLNYLHY